LFSIPLERVLDRGAECYDVSVAFEAGGSVSRVVVVREVRGGDDLVNLRYTAARNGKK
jgi:hypothetical protein